MIDKKAATLTVDAISKMTLGGFNDFNRLTRAIKDRDARAIRNIQAKWSGKSHASFDGLVLATLSREAANQFPVVADFSGMTRFRLTLESRPNSAGSFIGSSEVRKLVFDNLNRRAGGCGFPHELKKGSRYVKADFISHPDPEQRAESVEEYSVPGIRHVRVCMYFQRVAGSAFAYDIWGDTGGENLPLYNVFPRAEEHGIVCEKHETTPK